MKDEAEIPGCLRFRGEKYHLLCLFSLLVDSFLLFLPFSASQHSNIPVQISTKISSFLCTFHVAPEHNRFLLFFPASKARKRFLFIFIEKRFSFRMAKARIAQRKKEKFLSANLLTKSFAWWTIELTKLQFLQCNGKYLLYEIQQRLLSCKI